MTYITTGQLPPTAGPRNSLRTRLRAAFVYKYIEGGTGIEVNGTPLFTDNKLR
jgi:hypothetical protein